MFEREISEKDNLFLNKNTIAQNDWFRIIIEQSNTLVLCINSKGCIQFMNRFAFEILGYGEEIIGQPAAGTLINQENECAPFSLPWIDRLNQKSRDTFNLRCKISKKNGKKISIFWSVSIIKNPSGTISEIISIGIDCTRLSAREQRLNKKVHLYSKIIQNAPIPITSIDRDGIVRDIWNSTAEKVLGWKKEEAIDHLFPPMEMEKEKEQQDFLNWLPAKKTDNPLLVTRHKKNGEPINYFLYGTSLFDSLGQLDRKICVMVDITEYKQLEKEKNSLQEQLFQSQKMEAIGLLAGGIAHDFNNLLTVILGFSNIIRDKLTPENPLYKNILEILKAGELAAKLTQQLLTFSRKQILQPRILNINTMLLDKSRLFHRILREDMEIEIHVNAIQNTIHADPNQIELMVMNLVLNARDAMPTGGQITIETENLQLNLPTLITGYLLPAGTYVVLKIRDTGVGMEAQTQDKIFEPFFTTKDISKGTGLGLSVVYGVVKQSYGHISVISELGKGSTFSIYLPYINKPEDKQIQSHRFRHNPHRKKTIMLVEDNESVRQCLAQILQKNRFDILQAENGDQAIQIALQNIQPIDLLITDIIMPKMNGKELSDQMKILFPHLAIIYMSGYPLDIISQHGIQEEDISFLQKPFPEENLIQLIDEILLF